MQVKNNTQLLAVSIQFLKFHAIPLYNFHTSNDFYQKQFENYDFFVCIPYNSFQYSLNLLNIRQDFLKTETFISSIKQSLKKVRPTQAFHCSISVSKVLFFQKYSYSFISVVKRTILTHQANDRSVLFHSSTV